MLRGADEAVQGKFWQINSSSLHHASEWQLKNTCQNQTIVQTDHQPLRATRDINHELQILIQLSSN